MVVRDIQINARVEYLRDGRRNMSRRSRDTVAHYLSEQDCPFDVVDDETLTVRLLLAGRELHCTLKTPQGAFVMTSRFPRHVPAGKREQVLGMVARDICRPVVTSLYLNPDTGETGVKTAIPVEDGHLSFAGVGQIMSCNLQSAEQWIALIEETCDSDDSDDASDVR